MRIGEFAKKNKVSQDTIRYYLNLELLVAEKKGSQYAFSESDAKDLQMILKLKRMSFSLAEIQELLSVQRISGAKSEMFKDVYRKLLTEKQKEIGEELKKYEKLNSYLGDTLNDIRTPYNSHDHLLGVPLRALEIIACPQCSGNLTLNGCSVNNNMIQTSDLICSCGKQMQIKDGILYDLCIDRDVLRDIEPRQTKKEFLEQCSYSYVNFIYKGLSQLNMMINQCNDKPRVILEMGKCLGFFLMQYIDEMPEDTVYILIDDNCDRLSDLKRNLEKEHKHHNFLFVYSDITSMPIKNHSIDTIIDYHMTEILEKERKLYLPEVLRPFLMHDGHYIATSKIYDDSSKDMLQRRFIQSEYKIVDTCLMEPSVESTPAPSFMFTTLIV